MGKIETTRARRRISRCNRSTDAAYVQAPDNAESKRTEAKAGDLLLLATADLGRTGVVPEDFPTAYINQHLFILRLKKDLNPIFVAGYYSTEKGKAQIL